MDEDHPIHAPDAGDQPSGREAPPSGSGKVILLPLTDGPLARELALALARRGHSLILWNEAPENGEAPAQADLLDLQLEVERAGGISLAASELPAAAEAFGRLDAALAFGHAEAARLAAALAGLERRLRAPLMLILEAAGEVAPSPTVRPEEPARPDRGWSRLRVLRFPVPAPGADPQALQAAAAAIADRLGANTLEMMFGVQPSSCEGQ